MALKLIISLYIWIMGVLLTVLIMFAGLLLSLILPQRYVDPFLKISFRIMMRLLFIQVTSEGESYIDLNKTYIFMANHVSLFDVPVLEGYIPQFFRGVEAEYHFHWPVYGWAVRLMGNIPIKRQSIYDSIRSMNRAIDWIKSGNSLTILPEGHRTLDGKIGSFMKLPFHMAKRADVEIIPIGLSGLYQLKAKHSWYISPTKIKIKFGAPVQLNDIRSYSTLELRDHVRSRIAELIEYP